MIIRRRRPCVLPPSGRSCRPNGHTTRGPVALRRGDRGIADERLQARSAQLGGWHDVLDGAAADRHVGALTGAVTDAAEAATPPDAPDATPLLDAPPGPQAGTPPAIADRTTEAR